MRALVRTAERDYRPPELERAVRAMWEAEGTYRAVRARGERGERFFFNDGPPYTTGSIHLGTAWNKTLKDLVVRYLRMNGYNVRDQPGFDMHGLPIEVKVERALGIRNKREIEELGIDAFVSKCRQFALENLAKMTEQFRALGVWLDWERPYMTITNDYIEAAWWTLSRAEERGLLTRLERVVTWCPRCQTALAEAEVEYWDEEDPSIYVKFRAAEADEFFLIWTTTPWTLPADLAVTLHPDLTYVRARAVRGAEAETLIFVRDRIEDIKTVGGYDSIEVLEELRGSELEGRKYVHPLVEEVPWQRERTEYWAHRILVDPDMVTAENTGCVHTAPGHGPADFEVGKRYELPPFCPVDGSGRFTAEAGKYAGMELKAANGVILEDLRRKGLLLHSGTISHRYGHCWRCETPIIYIATPQWFLRVTELRERMLSEVARVRWYPAWAGSSRQRDWVEGARDWCISRQRYWGIPLPIWECSCGRRRVVGRVRELAEGKGYVEGMDLHRPWIDRVVFKCPSCGGEMRRVPDVMDVWLDSGVCSWAQLGYPGREEEFRNWWPPRWITEAHDQTRGWFYSQLGAGVIAFDRAPYDSVLMHGWSLDPQGRPMSKSLGNVVEPHEVTEKYGADALRLYFVSANAPWEDMPFSMENVRSAYKTLNILWNSHVFATTYMALDHFVPPESLFEEVKRSGRPEDLWLISRTQTLIERVTTAMESYMLHQASRAIEEFILEDLSRWYIKLVRDRVWVEGESQDKSAVYCALYEALMTVAKLLAPVAPHITERIYRDLGGRHQSVHMEDWPSTMAVLKDPELERDMAIAREVVEAALQARNKAGVKLRWPLPRIVISSRSQSLLNAVRRLAEIIREQTNCRELEVVEGEWSRRVPVPKPEMRALGPAFGRRANDVARAVREVWSTEIAAELLAGRSARIPTPEGTVEVTPAMVGISFELPEGFVEAQVGDGVVYLDTSVTDELRAEGLARDIVRRIQEMRKAGGLRVEDRIEARATLSQASVEMVSRHREFIMRETRAVELELRPAPEGAGGTGAAWGGEAIAREWELEGERVVLEIRKVP
ncbi:MAG: isoleucine--tRNA ligase [Thermoplasmata archaeon]